jgi:hypothetical protein
MYTSLARFSLGYFYAERKKNFMNPKGLNIKRLDANEISRKMEKHIADYFTGFQLCKNQSIFSEGFILHRAEVLGIIPVKHHPLFSDHDKFLGLSGYVTVTCDDGSTADHVVMLLLDEHHEYAYLLCTQNTDEDETPRNVIIKDVWA